jgi:hypothetical protein
MKFRVKWTATYETIIEAQDLDKAREAAADIDLDVKGSRYLEDSWEVLSMEPTGR